MKRSLKILLVSKLSIFPFIIGALCVFLKAIFILSSLHKKLKFVLADMLFHSNKIKLKYFNF